MTSVLEITWPESLCWIASGLVNYFLYGITHSNASNDKRIRFCDQRNTKTSNSPGDKKPDAFKKECLALSRRQESLYSINNIETFGNEVEENEKRGSRLTPARTIIKNYNTKPKHLSTQESQDIPLENTCYPENNIYAKGLAAESL